MADDTFTTPESVGVLSRSERSVHCGELQTTQVETLTGISSAHRWNLTLLFVVLLSQHSETSDFVFKGGKCYVKPSVSGMDPPFGDAFQNYTFADQALTSTDLLANSSDPDFIYELDRDMTCRQSPGRDTFEVEDCKTFESMENLPELIDNDLAYSSNFEQWDTYWEDLTKYTRLTSCDIWGTKEVDFLGLDDFSSPYQDEEVIGRTPTLAQLNSEDSQPVSDTLYLPDSLAGQKQTLFPPPVAGKKMVRTATSVTGNFANHSTLPDYAEGSQKATWPVPSSTETMAKAQMQGPSRVASPQPESTDYVRKAKLCISVPRKPFLESCAQQISVSASSPLIKEHELSASIVQSATIDTPSSLLPLVSEKKAETCKREPSCAGSTPELGLSRGKPQKLNFPVAGSSETVLTVSATEADATAAAEKKKEEEHNYSLFLTRARLAGKVPADMEEEDDEEEEDGEEEEEEEEAEGVDLDDEDHDEGFGSEHELSENEEEEEEEDDDYEGDKDDDISDAFSEPGCDTDMVEDVKGLTAGISRKRGKRRYFWEYSEQLTPSKQERMLKPSEWDRDTLPSNMYQKNGLHQGKYTLKKSRRTDVEDLTPNPRKLLQIGNELRKLNKVISDLTPVSELPLTARPRSRKEKNKLASRACRLKKKAQYEANKVKLWGLGTEYGTADRLLFVINTIKEEIVNRVQDNSKNNGTSMAEKLDKLIVETLVQPPVAGQTSDFVNQILENTGKGDPTGGLVGLRVPTLKV
ncbi:CREB3 regulatory factor [Bagarius yarrelli]|uniref:CREB3 regulatory factor n=1 Tax=Bagarius yarrelli TaxID=175774 RepID=A0A556UZH8_BAGYA|nr:CREB3 regulatory factor [Bagarius yarrelli]